MPRCIDFIPKTIAAPAAVTNHVKVVAINAAKTGLIWENQVIIASILVSI
jgi:hypothetical protein